MERMRVRWQPLARLGLVFAGVGFLIVLQASSSALWQMLVFNRGAGALAQNWRVTLEQAALGALVPGAVLSAMTLATWDDWKRHHLARSEGFRRAVTLLALYAVLWTLSKATRDWSVARPAFEAAISAPALMWVPRVVLYGMLYVALSPVLLWAVALAIADFIMANRLAHAQKRAQQPSAPL